jgi:hypothetical protein
MLHRSSHSVRFGGGHVYMVYPAVPKQPLVWRRLPAAVLVFVTGIPATILTPVVIEAWCGGH